MKVFLLISIIALFTLLHSCSSEDTEFDTAVLQDKSASIQLKQRIHLQETEGNYIGRLYSARVIRDAIYIADPVMGNVKVYGRDGEYRFSIGKKGEGPGEFIAPRGGITKIGDTLIVKDDELRRINFFSLGGEYYYSISLPSNIYYAGRGVIASYNDTILLPITEARHVLKWEKSNIIATIDTKGNVLKTFGKHPPEYSVYQMYDGIVSFDINRDGVIFQISRNSPIIQAYSVDGEKLYSFGVLGNYYKQVNFDSPQMEPVETILARARMKSLSINIFWLPCGHVVYVYENLNEEGQLARDPLLYDQYLMVYTDRGEYIPSEIKLPGNLITVDEDGLLYIEKENRPGERIIEVYELMIV